MSEIKINAVKLVTQKVRKEQKTTALVSYRKTLADGSHRDCEESGDAEVHPDFKKAMSALTVHLAVISEFVDLDHVDNVTPAMIQDFSVTSYSIGGKEDNEGIVITGHKILSTGKALGLNTPFTRFEEEDGYVFMEHVINQLGIIEDEAKAYLDGSKVGVNKQLNMAFDETTANA